MTLAGIYGNFDEKICDRTVLDGARHLVAIDAGLEAFIDDGTGLSSDDVPAFGFWISGLHAAAGFGVRVHLDREDVLGVEEFDKQGERAFVIGVAGYLGRVVAEGLGERGTGEGAIGDDGLILGEVGEFPAFTNFGIIGQGFMKDGFERLAAPDAFFENGIKFKWVGFHKKFQVSSFFLAGGAEAFELDGLSSDRKAFINACGEGDGGGGHTKRFAAGSAGEMRMALDGGAVVGEFVAAAMVLDIDFMDEACGDKGFEGTIDRNFIEALTSKARGDLILRERGMRPEKACNNGGSALRCTKAGGFEDQVCVGTLFHSS
jgi:hypothetical protein